MNKRRLDVVLIEDNYVLSREKAKGLILAGKVFVNSVKRDKPSFLTEVQDKIEVKDSPKFVSRGGLKLEHAINEFSIDVNGKTCIDVGASTGGFTDCLLKYGAKKVYAVDVGYGQFDYSLRNDERVVLMERQNARFLTRDMFDDPIDLAVIDCSFISLKLILPPIKELLKNTGEIIALIKPQFEAGKEKIGKRGVVKDAQAHVQVIEEICAFVSLNNLTALNLTYSPIKGPNGNIEYLICLSKAETDTVLDIGQTVLTAHNNLL